MAAEYADSAFTAGSRSAAGSIQGGWIQSAYRIQYGFPFADIYFQGRTVGGQHDHYFSVHTIPPSILYAENN
jgi:hypothetical protein